MEHQNQILQTLRAPESQARLERIVAQEALNNRAAVGRRVCAEFGFVDARGSAQLAGCLKALNTLHKAGRIALPASRRRGGAPTPQRFDAPVAAATAVPGTVEAVAGLSLERVEQGRQRRVWNTLLHFEHPQGTTTFAGCQVRYLVVSAHGVLGAVGFSAAALQLRAREAWMGWSGGQRLAHLHRVLCLSRFLIRPGVHCRNLASQVLGRVLARLAEDFEARYRYRPWLVETFVGPAHDGASFKAANFVWVGHTGAGLLASLPGEAITANASHDRAAVKGYYRLIDQPVSSAVTPGNILAPHRARTLQRMRGQDTVLCIQDGTDLNFATRPHCEGLGIIGRNQTASKTLGLHLHLTLAVDGAGLPLGVLRCGFEAPPGGTARPADEAPPAAVQETAPKTRRWVDGLRDIDRAAAALSRKTRVLSVMDREADCFAVFDEQRRLNRVEVLVRAHHDRCLAKGAPKLFAAMRAGAADGHVEIEIDRLSARRKSSGRQARPARSGRVARAEVRHRQVVAPPTIAGAEPLALSTVHVRETAPPPGEPAVEWFLLTSLDVDSTETAVAVIGYYLRRWRIEDLFRVLKSGCRVEHLAFHTADRLQRAVTINTVIAWRLMVMTLLGRDVPGCDAQLLFTDIELRFLTDYAEELGLPPPGHLAAAVVLLAILGGYQNRTHDPPPGHQIMWRGYERMSIATIGYRIGRRARAGVVQNE